MIVQCEKCQRFYDDEFRTTDCNHRPFWANDGMNNFEFYPESYYSDVAPPRDYVNPCPPIKHPHEE